MSKHKTGSHRTKDKTNVRFTHGGESPSLSTKGYVENARISLFIDLLYQSSYLRPPSKVLSGLLIGSAGTGKTLNLTKLASERHVWYANDISPKFVCEFLKKVDRGEKNMIVVPDFLTATEGSKHNRDNLIKLLRPMTEEGIVDVSHYGYPELHFTKPARAGLITAITFDAMNEFKMKWKSSGFLSRLIPFSYSLSEGFKNAIESNILSVESLKQKEYVPILKKKAINKSPKHIVLPLLMAYKLNVASYKLAEVTGSITAPFRQEKQVYTLAKAHCAMRRAEVVEDIDANAVIDLSNWLNLGFNKL